LKGGVMGTRATEEHGASPKDRRQVLLATVILVVGIVALGAILVAIPLLLLIGGLTPFEQLLETFQSTTTLVLAAGGIVAGFLAMVTGFATQGRMPTKRSREQSIAGAVLGLLAILAGGLLLAFQQAGDPEAFFRSFLNFDVLEGYWFGYLRATMNTIILAFAGEAGGIVLGLVLAVLMLSKRAVVRAPARIYSNFFRGTPLLFQLTVFYFGFLAIGLRFSAFQAAISVFILNTAAYAAEVFRAGIQSIERGQMEAARSLGMSYPQAMWNAIIPQAIRRVIPPLMNEFVILIKDTALVYALGLVAENYEIYTYSRDGYAATANATFFTIAAVAYLTVTLPLIRAVNAVEKRLRSGLVTVTS
jgi:His/Glu/Gln/Arg/opine family amino acid ABC transporter permease subunit